MLVITMSSTSMFPSFHKDESLPVQHEEPPTIRRRLSSASLKSMAEYSAPATEWTVQRSKSMSAMGENAGASIKSWWDSSWDWILSSKLLVDIEMNEEERAAIGPQNKASWRHVFYKLRTEIKKIIGADRGSYLRRFNSRRDVLPH